MRSIEKSAHIAPRPSEREAVSAACYWLPESYPRVLKDWAPDLPLPQAKIVIGEGHVLIPLRPRRLCGIMRALYPYWNPCHFGSV